MKPMLPTLVFEPPQQSGWLYEIKYDGFRGILDWRMEECYLWSRNGKDLLPQFPELEEFLKQCYEEVSPFLPLMLDGELVILENDLKGNFYHLQSRGRLKSKKKIEEAALKRPCYYLAFDLLMINGKSTTKQKFVKRKDHLIHLFNKLALPLSPSRSNNERLQMIPYDTDYKNIEERVFIFESEGIIAKLESSTWEEGKRSQSWRKVKNWKTGSCFITAYDEVNGYFQVGVLKGNAVIPLGSFTNGLDPETKTTLRRAVIDNSDNKRGTIYSIHPAICLDLHYLDWHDEQLREPMFSKLRFDLTPDQCTYEKFLIDFNAFPRNIDITNPDKILWKANQIKKIDFLRYLRKVSPFILPFLEDRLLTVIRAPHGEFGEYFYQKNKPSTAPEFVKSFNHDSNNMIICNDLQTLLWLGNQLAVEFHIPFQTINDSGVSEIVIDLDPPTKDHFRLAINAASIIKKVLDSFSLTGFVKFSGNKGMQVYIPLPEGQFHWEETRQFTEFLANFLTTYDPDSFTIERLKKNRHGKLYVDFVQHGEGKTIISPYSPRKTGLVAAPLFWDEINEKLNPDLFSMDTVLNRINVQGDPFAQYFKTKKEQPFRNVLNILQSGNLDLI